MELNENRFNQNRPNLDGQPGKSFTNVRHLIGTENVKASTPKGKSYWEELPGLPPEKPDATAILDPADIDPDRMDEILIKKTTEVHGYSPFANPVAEFEESPNITQYSTKDERNKEYARIVSAITTSKQSFDFNRKNFREQRSASIAKREKLRLEAKTDLMVKQATEIQARKEFNLISKSMRELQANIDEILFEGEDTIASRAKVEKFQSDYRNLEQQAKEIGDKYGLTAPKPELGPAQRLRQTIGNFRKSNPDTFKELDKWRKAELPKLKTDEERIKAVNDKIAELSKPKKKVKGETKPKIDKIPPKPKFAKSKIIGGKLTEEQKTAAWDELFAFAAKFGLSGQTLQDAANGLEKINRTAYNTFMGLWKKAVESQKESIKQLGK